MPAGEAVINPLELLNLKEVKDMLDQLPTVFNWVILDSLHFCSRPTPTCFRPSAMEPSWWCVSEPHYRLHYARHAVALPK